MTVSGIGIDGLLRIQQEVVWGTAIIDAPTFLPIMPDSDFVYDNQRIENANQIGSRIKQLPNEGRKVVTGNINMDVYPDILGKVFNLLLGASVDAGAAETAYTHYWFSPDSGVRIPTSWTVEQFKGADTGAQFAGVMVTAITITSDNQGNQKIAMTCVGKNRIDNAVVKPTVITVSSKTPYYFGQGSLSITPSGVGEITQKVDAFEITIDLAYDIEQFKVGDQGLISQPVFNGIPMINAKFTIDADKQFETYASDHKVCDIVLTVDSGQQAGSASGNFSYVIEVPQMLLATTNARANANEYMKMDLEFDGGYGGTTADSGADEKQFQIDCVDDTATYPAAAS